MIRDQSIVLVRRVVDCEIAVCGILNRISRPPRLNKFFVLISWLGDGRAWYALILTLPVLYGETGLMMSLSMAKIGVVNLALYKVIKSLTGRSRPCAVSANIILGTAPLDQYSFPSGHTKNLEGAKAFVDYVLSKEGQEFLVKQGVIPVRDDVKPPAGQPAANQIKFLPIPYEWAAQNASELRERFEKIMLH